MPVTNAFNVFSLWILRSTLWCFTISPDMPHGKHHGIAQFCWAFEERASPFVPFAHSLHLQLPFFHLLFGLTPAVTLFVLVEETCSLHSHLSTSLPALDCPHGDIEPPLTSHIPCCSFSCCFEVRGTTCSLPLFWCHLHVFTTLPWARLLLSCPRAGILTLVIYRAYFFCWLARISLPLLTAYSKFCTSGRGSGGWETKCTFALPLPAPCFHIHICAVSASVYMYVIIYLSAAYNIYSRFYWCPTSSWHLPHTAQLLGFQLPASAALRPKAFFGDSSLHVGNTGNNWH